jgi:hypothetical protein
MTTRKKIFKPKFKKKKPRPRPSGNALARIFQCWDLKLDSRARSPKVWSKFGSPLLRLILLLTYVPNNPWLAGLETPVMAAKKTINRQLGPVRSRRVAITIILKGNSVGMERRDWSLLPVACNIQITLILTGREKGGSKSRLKQVRIRGDWQVSDMRGWTWLTLAAIVGKLVSFSIDRHQMELRL